MAGIDDFSEFFGAENAQSANRQFDASAASTQEQVADSAHDRFMNDKLRRIESNPLSASPAERNAVFGWRDKREAEAAHAAAAAKADEKEAWSRGIKEREVGINERNAASAERRNEIAAQSAAQNLSFAQADQARKDELHAKQMEFESARIKSMMDKDQKEADDAARKEAERFSFAESLARAASMRPDGMIVGRNILGLVNEQFERSKGAEDEIVAAKFIKGEDVDGDGQNDDGMIAFFVKDESGNPKLDFMIDGEDFATARERLRNPVSDKVAVAGINRDARVEAEQIRAESKSASGSNGGGRGASLKDLQEALSMAKADMDEEMASLYSNEIRKLLSGGSSSAPSDSGAPAQTGGSASNVGSVSGRDWTKNRR